MPNLLRRSSACLLLVGGTLALAIPGTASAAPDGLTDAQLDRRSDLLTRLALHTDPSGLDLAPAELDHLEHGPNCMMVLVAELKEDRALFDDVEWADIADRLGMPGGAAGLQSPAVPPPPLGDQSCFGRTGANYVVGEHFVVEWDTTSIDESTANDALEALELSWQTLVEDLDWLQPPGSDQYPLLFYISNQNYAGAYTTVDYCTGIGYVPYMVAGRGSFSAGNWYKTMAGHEFHHSIQFGYSYAHEFYWWEATATWSEEYVYPQYNDWADMYVGFPYYPHIAANASDQNDQEIFYHMYAMGIFATYLDEYHGGHDVVQRTWEESRGMSGTYNYWLPEVVDDLDLEFGEIWAGFMATTAFMDFSEYNYYYSVLDTNAYDDVDDLPADGETQRDGPQSLGMNYLYFEDGLGDDGKYLQVDLVGSDDADNWNAVLVTGEGHTVDEYVAFELEDGVGSAWIPFDSDQEAFLVVSPVDYDAQGYGYDWGRADEFEYEWEACLVDSVTGVACGEDVPDPGDDGNTDDPASPGGDDDDDDTAAGCGCMAPAAPATGMVWALGLLGLAARRRR